MPRTRINSEGTDLTEKMYDIEQIPAGVSQVVSRNSFINLKTLFRLTTLLNKISKAKWLLVHRTPSS